ncbi:acyl-CoA thioesterase [Chitinimonas sp. BJB300]|uniref:acyl-CoA thioesterase n=1 Tax=Chitinimonas sp. BJB300 TaxID=1559339 RepID=UPI000C118AC5|nr:acyl-CoA thioesterase [Chitinimonas sp. BJB300]PHV11822.1 thioesterase [Chitinimonas sp. BJB300]TSJ87033.1 acyl-CoA thioesterase [Chitinimonas sp. BJB300]
MSVFRQPIEVRWVDCDANQHVRHSAYADFCTHARIEWLRASGFGFDQFQQNAFGPVIFKESTEYFKEVRMSERLQIEVRIAALAIDGSRFSIRHEIFKEDGRLAARHEVSGAWLDLCARKLMAPPPALQAIFAELGRTDDFVEVPLKQP